jgi:3-hydroxybutyryl-CoA dehydrogenase
MIIHTICVCGGGTMGRGIATVTARAGFSTILYELNPVVLQKAREDMEKDLQFLIEKGKLEAVQKEKILQRIQFTSDMQSCIADTFIEAIIEDVEKKVVLFNQLADLNPGDCIFATNTSSLSVTVLASRIKNPERLIGMHFFNPATVMKLVEVVYTEYTSLGVTRAILDLAGQLGKTAVVCKDAPGFIVNRVARPYYIESLRIAEESRDAQPDFLQIDRLLEATGFKMGPFKLMDLIGNDINYAVSCSVYEQLQQPERLKPSFIQKEKVDKGELGRKTKTGYYTY